MSSTEVSREKYKKVKTAYRSARAEVKKLQRKVSELEDENKSLARRVRHFQTLTTQLQTAVANPQAFDLLNDEMDSDDTYSQMPAETRLSKEE